MGLCFVLRSEDERVSPAHLSAIAAAIRLDQETFAAAYNLSPSNVLTDGLAQEVPKDAILVRIVDASKMDVPNAEAYHSIDDQGRPYVLVGTFALDNGGGVIDGGPTGGTDSVSIAIDHEIKETEADRGVNLWADRFDGLTEVAWEPVDPFQGGHYTTAGVWLADYALPAWFDPSSPAGAKLNALGDAVKPLVLGVGGYQVLRHVSVDTSTEWGKHKAACLSAGKPAPSHEGAWVDFHDAVPAWKREAIKRRVSHRLHRHEQARRRYLAAKAS
jgi:hypothetical protein